MILYAFIKSISYRQSPFKLKDDIWIFLIQISFLMVYLVYV